MIEKVRQLFEHLKTLSGNESVKSAADWLTFIIAMLPIPGVSHGAAVASKVMADRELKAQFDGIAATIQSLDARIGAMESGLDRIGAMQEAARGSQAIQGMLAAFFEALKARGTEINIDTSDWSRQAFVNTLLQSDLVSISASRYSQNIIARSDVQAQKTTLKATGHSSNLVSDSKFTGPGGEVTLEGTHTQQGTVIMEGPSFGFRGPNAALEANGWSAGTNERGDFQMASFGTPFMTVSTSAAYDVRCNCGYSSKISERDLQGKSTMQCPACGAVGQVRR
jgi:hypothetical protein